MNYNREDHNQWPHDRGHHYNRTQQPPHNQSFHNQEGRGQDWGRQPNERYNDYNRRNEYQHENDDSRMHNRFGNDYRNEWQTENQPYRTDYGDSRYSGQEYNPSGNYRSGHNQGHDSYEDHNRYRNPQYSDRSFRGQGPDHNNSDAGSALAAGSVGGSHTSYSASQSRRGHMGRGRSGGMLNREGPGMNRYSRGDINANSNW